MTTKQTALYWRTWSSIAAEYDYRHNDSSKRHEIHIAAGCPESHTAWDNADFDRFLAHARAILGQPHGGIQTVDEAGARRRLLWRIRQDARRANLSDEYLSKLCRDLHGLGGDVWTLLPIPDLIRFRDLVHNRARAHTRKPPAPHRQASCTARANCPF